MAWTDDSESTPPSAEGLVIGSTGPVIESAASIHLTAFVHEITGAEVITEITGSRASAVHILKCPAGSSWQLAEGGNIAESIAPLEGASIAVYRDGATWRLLRAASATAVAAGHPLTTKGDLFTHSGADIARLPVGDEGQIIVADPAAPNGIAWEDLVLPPDTHLEGDPTTDVILLVSNNSTRIATTKFVRDAIDAYGGGGGVTSFEGRTGDVEGLQTDYDEWFLTQAEADARYVNEIGDDVITGTLGFDGGGKTVTLGSDVEGGFAVLRETDPPVALSAALAGAPGNVDNGSHYYAVTFLTDSGETEPSALSPEVVVADKTVDGQVLVTGIELRGDADRKLYRTKVGDVVTLYLVATLAPSAGVSYTDNATDVSLGAQAPAVNTTLDPILYVDEKGAIFERGRERALGEWENWLDNAAFGSPAGFNVAGDVHAAVIGKTVILSLDVSIEVEAGATEAFLPLPTHLPAPEDFIWTNAIRWVHDPDAGDFTSGGGYAQIYGTNIQVQKDEPRAAGVVDGWTAGTVFIRGTLIYGLDDGVAV